MCPVYVCVLYQQLLWLVCIWLWSNTSHLAQVVIWTAHHNKSGGICCTQVIKWLHKRDPIIIACIKLILNVKMLSLLFSLCMGGSRMGQHCCTCVWWQVWPGLCWKRARTICTKSSRRCGFSVWCYASIWIQYINSKLCVYVHLVCVCALVFNYHHPNQSLFGWPYQIHTSGLF